MPPLKIFDLLAGLSAAVRHQSTAWDDTFWSAGNPGPTPWFFNACDPTQRPVDLIRNRIQSSKDVFPLVLVDPPDPGRVYSNAVHILSFSSCLIGYNPTNQDIFLAT